MDRLMICSLIPTIIILPSNRNPDLEDVARRVIRGGSGKIDNNERKKSG